MADTFEQELMLELNKQNKDFNQLMAPHITMDQIQLNLSVSKQRNQKEGTQLANFNLDNIDCQTRAEPLSGQDKYDSSAERSPMKNEMLLKLSEGKITSRMSMNN